MSENTSCVLNSIGAINHLNGDSIIEINKKIIPALKNLSKFSHVILMYSDSKNHSSFLQSTIKLVKVNEKTGVIHFQSSVAIHASSVVFDIKPYIPHEDRVKECSQPPKEKINSIFTATAISSEGISTVFAPIGTISKENGKYFLQVENFEKCIDTILGYSHIRVFWWFNRFDKASYRFTTQCDPPYENAPKCGVFACRSPVRPNPIAMTTVKVIEIDYAHSRIQVHNLDCFHSTPLVGIAPYIPDLDRISNFAVPKWLVHWPEWIDDRSYEENLFVDNFQDTNETILQKYVQKGLDATILQENFWEEKPKHTAISNSIVIEGAKQNNLKDIDITIPYGTLTVVAGVSGSGKSSLAFDTIYAESRRRFVDHLGTGTSEYMEKPEFSSIVGLPPAIAIAQKAIGRNPRSTVGTITDVHDRLRVLFASIGVRHCPECGEAITPMSIDEILLLIERLPDNITVSVTPYGKNMAAFTCASGTISNVELRTVVTEAIEQGAGAILLTLNKEDTVLLQTTQMCYHCQRIFFELSPALFSFNNAESMCPVCNGLGKITRIDQELVVSRPHLSLLDGASDWWGDLRRFIQNPNANWMKGEIVALAEKMQIDLEVPWERLPEEFRQKAMFGSDGEEITFSYTNKENGRNGTITRPAQGAIPCINRLLSEGKDNAYLQTYIKQIFCDSCDGERLAPEGRLVSVAQTRFPQVSRMNIRELMVWVKDLPEKLKPKDCEIAKAILRDMCAVLLRLEQAGLSYLHLDRPVPTLSGGELQRIKLISGLSGGISNILYVLDEPTAGLHPHDYGKLIKIMQALKEEGNTIVAVEHEAAIMRSADFLIDMGPGAGKNGGEIIFAGTPQKIMENPLSETGLYLSRKKEITRKKEKIAENKGSWVSISGAKVNNLKNIDITFPLGKMTSITGVSGSGKSSLVSGVICPAIDSVLQKNTLGDFCSSISGAESIDGIVYVRQNPIGRSTRSTPATYTGIFDEIRNLYAETPESKKRGYKAGTFSFNSKEGQCEACKGEGRQCTPVPFSADIWTVCPICGGKRYKADVLEVKFKDKNIYDVLSMTVENAVVFFDGQTKLQGYLQVLMDVGLGYMGLGQSATTLSGGEAQRVKLAKELMTQSTGKIVYLLDEPTTGLHFSDVQNLVNLLHKITQSGSTVITIEHNMDMIKNADWIIDLGPDGGDEGGAVVGQGTPEQIAGIANSCTGAFLNGGKK